MPLMYVLKRMQLYIPEGAPGGPCLIEELNREGDAQHYQRTRVRPDDFEEAVRCYNNGVESIRHSIVKSHEMPEFLIKKLQGTRSRSQISWPQSETPALAGYFNPNQE